MRAYRYFEAGRNEVRESDQFTFLQAAQGRNDFFGDDVAAVGQSTGEVPAFTQPAAQERVAGREETVGRLRERRLEPVLLAWATNGEKLGIAKWVLGYGIRFVIKSL